MREFELQSGLYDEQPVIEEKYLKKYYHKVKDKLDDFFKRHIGRQPYLGRIKIKLCKLPTYLYKVGNKIGISKIFGAYEPSSNSVYIDPVCLPELNDPERAYLKKYFRIPSAERTLAEELVHADQTNSGIISKSIYKYGKRAREYIEGAAAHIADMIYGYTDAYKSWKERFRRAMGSLGLRKAYYL
ncbi:MAG: hypothetical protein QXP39_02550 [Candidatus Aenigmatarchaeota archaeon]